MDAQPELALLAKALNENRLEAILIGNMAAALHGAPVSTIDIDLYFRKTPANMRKLKQVATALEAVIMRPYYPVSALFRLQRDRDGLQIDFMGQIDGVKSYESVGGHAAILRSRRTKTSWRPVWTTSSEANGPRGGRRAHLAVIDILEKTRDEEANTAKTTNRR